MKALLMHRNRDADREPLPEDAGAQIADDLNLDTLFSAMAGNDRYLFETVRKIILTSVENDADTILYRQAVLQDCLANRDAIRQMYALAVEALERQRRDGFGMPSGRPGAMLSGAVRIVEIMCGILRRLRMEAAATAAHFTSEGLRRLCGTLQSELADDYFFTVARELDHLKFREGVLISAAPGRAGKGTGLILREPRRRDRNWLLGLVRPAGEQHTLHIDARDDAGWRAMSELRDQGLVLVADALRSSAEHIVDFFRALRFELSLYVGCINLAERLAGHPWTWPVPLADDAAGFSCRGLCNVCLALNMGQQVTGNDVDALGHPLVIITGANRGGKSTFLASVGQAQLMMQAGIFVMARAFSAPLRDTVCTHYVREEDATMRSGKFDEELGRMSDMVEQLGSRAMILFNESFSATNEREGSEVAHQIVSALLDHGALVLFVTHMYEFASGFRQNTGRTAAVFLRAERDDGGSRNFQLCQGEPLQTGFAQDLYRDILADTLSDSARRYRFRR